MSWKKVLLNGDVASVQDLFAVASGDLPASGSFKGVTVDSAGLLDVGDVGSTLQLQDTAVDTGTGSDTLNFINYLTCSDTAGTGEVDINITSGALDGDVLLAGSATSGLLDFTTSTTVNSALDSIDSILGLLAPPLAGNINQLNFSVTQSITNNGTTQQSRNMENQNTGITSSCAVIDPDHTTHLIAHLEGDNNSGAGGSEHDGAFQVVMGASNLLVETYDVSTSTWVEFHNKLSPMLTVETAATVSNNGATTSGGGTYSSEQKDTWSVAGSAYATGFSFINNAAYVSVVATTGAGGLEVGYLNNKVRFSNYTTAANTSQLGDTVVSSNIGILDNYGKASGGGTDIYELADGNDGVAGASASWTKGYDNTTGNSVFGDTHYVASGITRYKAGNKVNLVFNTATYGWVEDAAGDFYMDTNAGDLHGYVSNSAAYRGAIGNFYYDKSEYTASYLAWANVKTILQFIGKDTNLGNLGSWSTAQKAIDANVCWTIDTDDGSDSMSNLEGADSITDLKDFHATISIAGLTKSTNLSTLANNPVDDGWEIATISKASPVAENTVRVRTETGYYSAPATGVATTQYDKDADITSGTYADSLCFNGHQFYSLGYSGRDFRGSASSPTNLRNNNNSYIGYNYTSLASGSAADYKYMMQRFTMNSSATAQIRLYLRDFKWAVDTVGNNAGVIILAKLRKASNHDDMSAWFNCSLNMGASPPLPTDPNGTACHYVGSPDNDYSGTDLLKIINLGSFLNTGGFDVEVLVRVGLQLGATQSIQNTMNFTSVHAEPNI